MANYCGPLGSPGKWNRELFAVLLSTEASGGGLWQWGMSSSIGDVLRVNARYQIPLLF